MQEKRNKRGLFIYSAFHHFKEEVENDIIGQVDAASAVRMSDLRRHYVPLLRNEGVVTPIYLTSNVKVRFQRCFIDKIQFVRTPVNESEKVLKLQLNSGSRCLLHLHCW